MAGKNWSRRLPQPIIIPDLKITLRTLADVQALIAHVPKERRETRIWQHVAREVDAAVRGGDIADASIALRLAFMIEHIEHKLGSV
jgi:hypothetical protein